MTDRLPTIGVIVFSGNINQVLISTSIQLVFLYVSFIEHFRNIDFLVVQHRVAHGGPRYGFSLPSAVLHGYNKN